MFRRVSDPVRAVVVAAGLVAGYMLFTELVTLLVTLLITLIIALPLAACATWCERRGGPRVAGALLGLLLGLAVLGGALALIIPPFVQQFQAFVDEVPRIFAELQARVSEATGARPSEVGERIQNYLQGFVDKPVRLVGPAASVGLGVAGVLATMVLIVMAAFYIAVRPQPLLDAIIELFPQHRQAEVLGVMEDIRQAWFGWLKGVGVDMVISGLLLYVGLRLVDLDYAIVFATLTALLVVIPYIGSIVSALPPLLLALADSPTKALLVLGVYIAVQQIEGNVLVPLVMSRAVSLHPAFILGGVVLVGRLVGFIGLFVAVPILSAIVILVRELWIEPMRRLERAQTTPTDTTTAETQAGEPTAVTMSSSLPGTTVPR